MGLDQDGKYESWFEETDVPLLYSGKFVADKWGKILLRSIGCFAGLPGNLN